MRDEKLAGSLIEAVVNAVDIPVTLKMRTGWDDNTRNAPQLARIAENLGIKMVTVHGRTRCQCYKGKANLALEHRRLNGRRQQIIKLCRDKQRN